jgi:putative membrane protein
MPRLLSTFLVRWGVSALGLWIAEAILGEEHFYLGGSFMTLLITALLLALVSTLFKPFIVFLSLPAILITLGLFMLVVNGLTILIVSWLYDPFVVDGLWWAILAGIILGLVNLLVSIVMSDLTKKEQSKDQ